MEVCGQRHVLPDLRPGTTCAKVLVGPRAGQGGCGKSRPHRDPISNLLACSEFLYCVSYPAPHMLNVRGEMLTTNTWIIQQRVFISTCY